MRDEWFRAPTPIIDPSESSYLSSPGLTSQPQQQPKKQYQQKTGDGAANKPSMGNISLSMASRAMRLKRIQSREVSERRQVGDAEELVNPQEGTKPWWRDVTMEEGM